MQTTPRPIYRRLADGAVYHTIRELPDFVSLLGPDREPRLFARQALAADFARVNPAGAAA